METSASDRLLHRPIFGGVFGSGRYALASMPCVSRGLHSIRYMVVEPYGGGVLSVSEDKVGALADARRVLNASCELAAVGHEPAMPEQLAMWPADELPEPSDDVLKPVSRRRREIYWKCVGKCHYCGVDLNVDGPWHVEHMMPRALGGNDDPLNLVAACVGCNLGKADRTALEFVSQR